MQNAQTIQYQYAETFNDEAATPEVMIVVPCYNEAERLDLAAFLEFIEANPNIGFVFVDDGSTDATLGVLTKLRITNFSQCEVIALAKNGGKAEAVRAGLNFACGTPAKLIGYWDADLATPLDAINDFVNVFNRFSETEVVFGSRRTLIGHRINRTWDRRLISKICSTLARVVISLPISDTQCGAKLFRNNYALRHAISAPFRAGWLFDVELFARLSSQAENPYQAFYEFPLSEWEEIPGSKVSAKAILRAGVSILELIGRVKLLGQNLTPEVAGTIAANVIQLHGTGKSHSEIESKLAA